MANPEELVPLKDAEKAAKSVAGSSTIVGEPKDVIQALHKVKRRSGRGSQKR